MSSSLPCVSVNVRSNRRLHICSFSKQILNRHSAANLHFNSPSAACKPPVTPRCSAETSLPLTHRCVHATVPSITREAMGEVTDVSLLCGVVIEICKWDDKRRFSQMLNSFTTGGLLSDKDASYLEFVWHETKRRRVEKRICRVEENSFSDQSEI